MQTLFDKGIEGKKPYVKHREPYKNLGNYTIFPTESEKMPYLSDQEYAIAINKNTSYHKWLLDLIDDVLDNPIIENAKKEISKPDIITQPLYTEEAISQLKTRPIREQD